MTLPMTHRRVVLANRPNGMVSADNFRLEEVSIPEPRPGQVLVRQIIMSLDPYMRSLWTRYLLSRAAKHS